MLQIIEKIEISIGGNCYFVVSDKTARTSARANVVVIPDLTLDGAIMDAIDRALLKCHGNKLHAAEMLGITRVTLYNKIKKYGLDKELVDG